MKLWGSAMILLAFMSVGENIARLKRRRLSYIEKMIQAIAEFEVAVECFMLPVPKALEKSGILDNRAFADKGNFLTKEDDMAYSFFISGVGACTVTGQLENARMYKNRLSSEEAEERERYKKENGLIRGGSLLFGLLLVVMLL